MGKFLFTIKYEINPEQKEEFLNVLSELKNIVSADGLESYHVYQLQNKKNCFEEVYKFKDETSFDAFDDNQDERTSLLMAKLSEMVVKNTTEYKVLKEIL